MRNCLRRSVQGDRNDGRHNGTQGGEVDGAHVERPDGLPGKEGLMLMIEYPPGSSDPIHRHNAHGFIYVLEGSIVIR